MLYLLDTNTVRDVVKDRRGMREKLASIPGYVLKRRNWD